MKKIVGSIEASCSLAMTASFMEAMQQTELQCGIPFLGSLEPTHCIHAIL